jgi:hypothetical protein
MFSLEGKGRRPRRHVKLVDLHEGANNFFAHSIRENLILKVGTKT